jgi:hypothetical protein
MLKGFKMKNRITFEDGTADYVISDGGRWD